MLYLISGYLHRSISSTGLLYFVLMLPGTIVHETSHAVAALLMGARITDFSIIPSGNTLGHVEHTAPRIPLIGNAAISIAPFIGCPAVLLLTSGYFGVHFTFPASSFDIVTGTRFLLEGAVSFIRGLDYLDWRTYVFLYLSLTLGAGAAPSRTDIMTMLPGLIIAVFAVLVLDYFNIRFLFTIFSWLSGSLLVAMIPLLAVTIVVAILKFIQFARAR